MTNASNQKVFMFHFINLWELIINNYYEKCSDNEPDICCEKQLIMATGFKRVELL